MTLPCLTLHQPWASLISLGVKRIETRSWAAPSSLIGQRIGIHAAKRIGLPDGALMGGYILDGTTIYDSDGVHGDGTRTPLPLGAIVATATITDCVPMVGQDHIQPRGGGKYLRVYEPDSFAKGALWLQEPLNEKQDRCIGGVHDQRPYGDFAPGRFAWLLEDVKPTGERCPACWRTPEHANDDAVLAGWDPMTKRPPCVLCNEFGRCDPVPARGRQRIWHWTPK